MKKNVLVLPCIILAALCVVLLVFMLIFLNDFMNASHSNEMLTKLTEELSQKLAEAEKAEAVNAFVTIETEMEEKNYTVIFDNGIDQIEYPVIEGATLNDYNMELLEINDKKRKVLYNENGEKRSRFGIDVSSYQGKIDWNAAAADGVEFAIIRAGYRGYETGSLNEDKYFRRNIEGAKAAGIDTGVYFYSQALNEEEALEEADFLLSLLNESGADISLPVVFDWEFPTDEDPARTDNMTAEAQILCCKAFCDRIKSAGYDPMYYATVNTALFRYDMGELSDYSLWIAEYGERTAFTYDYAIWQYSCSGVVDGIDALTDLNIMIVK
ncbi:MAG: glycoside hydrolase family 25 protein [Huintestinicola sp.]